MTVMIFVIKSVHAATSRLFATEDVNHVTKYIVIHSLQFELQKIVSVMSLNSWALQSLANVTKKRDNWPFAENYFQQRINTHLVQ